MTDDTLSRRRILELSGVALAGLAGCTGASGSGATETPTATKPTATQDSHHEETGHHEQTTQTATDGHAHHAHHDGHHHEKIPQEPKDHVEVTMLTTEDGNYHYSPHLAWVKPGGTVTWVNKSGSHTATAYASKYDKPGRIPTEAEPWDSGLLTEQGASFEHTFEVEGVYDYYCKPHEQFGMLGTVIVGNPDPHDQPGLAAPQESLPKKAQTKITDLNGMVNKALGHTHGEQTATESSGHHEEGGHHEETSTAHHEGTTTESGHHEEGSHHEETATETGHHHEE